MRNRSGSHRVHTDQSENKTLSMLRKKIVYLCRRRLYRNHHSARSNKATKKQFRMKRKMQQIKQQHEKRSLLEDVVLHKIAAGCETPTCEGAISRVFQLLLRLRFVSLESQNLLDAHFLQTCSFLLFLVLLSHKSHRLNRYRHELMSESYDFAS